MKKLWQKTSSDEQNENEVFAFQQHYVQHNNSQFMKNISLLTFIMLICTLLSLFIKSIDSIESNVVMVYLLGVIIFSYLANGYVYNFLASLSGVLLYNFFFTEPYYSSVFFLVNTILPLLHFYFISLLLQGYGKYGTIKETLLVHPEKARFSRYSSVLFD